MTHFNWTVIGAGPAGLAAIGNLLDQKIPALDIAWVDPQFQVGDFGTRWRNVPSNTKVLLFLKFLLACESFAYDDKDSRILLNTLDPNAHCPLGVAADALQTVSDRLVKQVVCFRNYCQRVKFNNGVWEVYADTKILTSNNVILATGSEPNSLALDHREEIHLIDALDVNKLQTRVLASDTVGVFGSSHSAVLVLANLVSLNVKNIVNVYRSPLCYAIYFDDFILFDDSGLKGFAADWARGNLEKTLPDNLQRHLFDEQRVGSQLLEFDKVIYAVGFSPRKFPVIEGVELQSYSDNGGKLAPGLYGIGIAYPELMRNPVQVLGARVGLWKFMDYLQRHIKDWL